MKNQEFEDKLSNEMKNRDEVVLRTIKGSMRRMIRIERVIAKDDKDRESHSDKKTTRVKKRRITRVYRRSRE